MDEQELKQFLKKLASGDYTDEEYRAFVNWVENCNREQYAEMLTYWEQFIDKRDIFDVVNSQLIENIEKGLDKIDKRRDMPVRPLYPEIYRRRSLWPRIAVAASILIFLSAGAYFMLYKQSIQQIGQNQSDVAPGSNKAILKSHGKIYNINEAKNGLLAQQGNTTISKMANGQLVYNSTNAGNEKMVYDTLIIPRGGQYRLKLADGSVAYLNADSKIRYPENFTGKERKVELISGEAYFEVVHNAKIPFRVSTGKQVVEDIGTHFNINAYVDEPAVKTTLVEGRVKISKGIETIMLKPGQQAVSQPNSSIVIQNADVDEITAWKDGMFRFNNIPLASIMKQVSRWYNVDVIYDDESLQAKPFGLITTRFGKVSELLHVLEMTDKVQFKIEGRKIVVMNK